MKWKIILAFIILVPLLTSYFAFLVHQKKLSSVVFIDNPWSFTSTFKPNSSYTYTEELGFDYALEGRELLSPNFPFSKLTTVYVNSNPAYERAITIDPVWNIFWIEDAPGQQHVKFYGPFRFNGDIDAIRTKQRETFPQNL